MRPLLRTLFCLAGLLATPVSAQNSPVVVELYTSQGCSSCPPADEMLLELSQREGVIALALHVDYWDYIGWVDEFANPAHTRRQQDYARAAGHTTIYTPQFVVGGRDLVIGAKAMELVDTIQAHRETALPVSVSVDRVGTRLTIAAEMADGDADSGPYVIQLAQITAVETVEIKRGENAGRTMTYSSVVRSIDLLHQWDGAAPVELRKEVGEVDRYAVIVQRGTNGPVVGAAQIN